jgi:Icc-related predicted phosphoesterase
VRRLRILAFSDLHRDRDRARKLVDLAREADVVVAAGDFASMHIGLGRTVDVLSRIEQPAIVVPGNNETESALRSACLKWPSATVLHGDGTSVDGVEFFGLGCGIPVTPFPWSADLTDAQAAPLLSRCPEHAVLVVHSPPKGYVDRAWGRHLGSTAILSAIEVKQPRLALCGHIHEAWGQEATVGRSRVVNLGPHGRFFEV